MKINMKVKRKVTLTLNNREVSITNGSKILFPHKNITKREFVEYYQNIAPVMFPYIKNRLVSMDRFPDGIDGETFFQKDAKGAPDWVKTIPVESSDGKITNYISFNEPATLLYVANLIAVPHCWLSRAPAIAHPDRMIFDLDPAGRARFKLVIWAAKKIKKVLDKLGLPSFIMTTGSKGLHIVIPLKPSKEVSFDMVRDCAKRIAQVLVKKYPKRFTLEMAKEDRGNRIFIDYLRNGFSATSVAPYAIRAKPGAPVATPITWKEMYSGRLSAQKYHIKNILRRLSRIEDPWKNIEADAVAIENYINTINEWSASF